LGRNGVTLNTWRGHNASFALLTIVEWRSLCTFMPNVDHHRPYGAREASVLRLVMPYAPHVVIQVAHLRGREALTIPQTIRRSALYSSKHECLNELRRLDLMSDEQKVASHSDLSRQDEIALDTRVYPIMLVGADFIEAKKPKPAE
jgi:hypothetical protein